MIYLTELIASHPKILRAGRRIGEARGGAMAALGLFVAAIGYARQHRTNGVVPDEYLANVDSGGVRRDALQKVGLLRRVNKMQWRIRDYFDFNPTAEEAARKQALNRARQSKFRAAEPGETAPAKQASNAVTPALVTHLSRSIHYPLSTKEKEKRVQRPDGRAGRPPGARPILTASQRAALARLPQADRNYRILVRLIHVVMATEGLDDATAPELVDAVKWTAARKKILYPPDVLDRALRSVAAFQRRRSA